ncbi:hypothetical protein KGQ55_03325 [Patescibacteria group bacterium]|nr:hypothetical protein [Patescibacteria group bacterium]
MKKILISILGIAFALAPAFAFADGASSTAAAPVPAHPGPFASTTNAARRAQLLERRAALASSTEAHRAAMAQGALERAKQRADQEISRRVDNLTKALDRIDGMKRLSDTEKASLKTSIQAQIDSLTALGGTIASETATSTLRADIQSITKSYRIYALVIPQSALTAAADRVLSVATQMDALASKISDRLASAAGAGTDVSALQSALADMQAKLADAQAQANAAISEVSALAPDNGDQTIWQSNLSAMKDARSKVEAAQQDIVSARKDVEGIVQGIRGIGTNTATTSPNGGGRFGPNPTNPVEPINGSGPGASAQ